MKMRGAALLLLRIMVFVIFLKPRGEKFREKEAEDSKTF